MHPRAAELIATLALGPHPEGGFYRQIYKSGSTVEPSDSRGSRTALTTIFFLLPAGDVSRWHRVSSDEVWHFYEGAPLELFTADPALLHTASHQVGPVDQTGRHPVHVVAAGDWQAARTTGEYTLVGCTVGPGFEFVDFEMLRDREELSRQAAVSHPGLAFLV